VSRSDDAALYDFLEMRRVAMRLKRGLIDVVFVEQEQIGVLGGPVAWQITHSGSLALTSGAMRRNAASTSLPRPAFTSLSERPCNLDRVIVSR